MMMLIMMHAIAQPRLPRTRYLRACRACTAAQKRVDYMLSRAPFIAMRQMIENKAEAEALRGFKRSLAEAVSRLTQAQTAVQASAQVFASLKNTSLLDFLK